MVLYTSPDGFEFTDHDLSELAYLASQARNMDEPKARCEHVADDVLWSLGWFCPSRVSPELRATAGGKP